MSRPAPQALAPSAPAPAGRRLAAALRSTSGIYAALGLLLVVSGVLVALDGGNLFTVTNLRNMLVRSIALGVVAVGQTLVIVGGSLDLSVAYLLSASAVLVSFLMDGDPARMPLAVGAVLALGVGVGLVNGLLVTRLRINPFIATLGTGLVLRGALNSGFTNFSGEVAPVFGYLGYGLVGPVPVSVLLLVGVAAAAAWALRSTRFGAHLYAVGGSEEIARLSGVRSDWVLIRAHVLCSLAAVVSGMYIASRLGSGAPWVGPDGGYDLESVAAVVLGGAALSGGRGGVPGTIAGVLVLAVLDNVFNALGVDAFLKQVIRGVIIVAAVASYTLRSRTEAA